MSGNDKKVTTPKNTSGKKSDAVKMKKPDRSPARVSGKQSPSTAVVKKQENSVALSDKVREKRGYRTVKAEKKQAFPGVVILFMLICTILVMFMVINYVQINEYTREISDMKDELGDLQQQEKNLTLELEKKNDLRAIEDYAENKLGMVSSDELRRVYIDIEKEDKIDDYDTDGEDVGVIATLLNALGENLRSYWNIFAGDE